MEGASWLIAVLGAALVVVALVDVFLTVLHIDTDGRIERGVVRGVWWVVMAIARRFPETRRSVVALAGPFMILTLFATWIGLFIFGFALIYWPFLELFRADDPLMPLGFVDALYFSGVAATILGYGDITPIAPPLQVASFVQAGLGFALVSGSITYLINVVMGVAERNALAFRLWTECAGTGDGTVAMARSLAYEDSDVVIGRLRTLLGDMRSFQQKMSQFPILDLFYRSKDPALAPEIMIRSAAQMAIAARLAAADPRYRSTTAVADELAEVVSAMITLIADQHLDDESQHQLESPGPGAEDQGLLQRMRARLVSDVPGLDLPRFDPEGDDAAAILELVARTRIFLDQLDTLTDWRVDHPRKA